MTATRLHGALPGSTRSVMGSLQAVLLGQKAFIVAHPLWDVRQPTLHADLATASAAARAQGLAPEFRSTFMLARRPYNQLLNSR